LRFQTLRPPRLVMPLLLGILLAAATACQHHCKVSRFQARFSVPSCCTDQVRYFWDDVAKDCLELRSTSDGQNCGCLCHGEGCDRLFSSRDECRKGYAHCR